MLSIVKLLSLKNRLPILALLGVLISIWPTIIWVKTRMSDGSDNSWGLLALATAFIISVTKRLLEYKKQRPQFNVKQLNGWFLIYVVFLFLDVYPLAQAVAAALLIASILSYFHSGSKINFGLMGLMILSLPLFASLDFYLGYPLRYLVGLVSSKLLQFQGLSVYQQGVNLVMANQVIVVDGPCSGIKMMWTASFLVSSFVALFGLNLKCAIKLGMISICLVLVANILRVTALFYIESGLLKELQWMHEYVGLISYGFTAIAIVSIGLRQVSAKYDLSGKRLTHEN